MARIKNGGFKAKPGDALNTSRGPRTIEDAIKEAQSETNVEFVTRLMEFSQTGAMAQAVIITAIEKYVDMVLEDEADARRQMASVPFINPDAWIAACREIKVEIGKRGT